MKLRVTTVVLWTMSSYVLAFNSATDVTCRDDDGNPIEWFYATKLPRNKSSRTNNELLVNGSAYFYLLSSEPDIIEWTQSEFAIDNSRSMFGRTLSVLYDETQNVNYVLYNDEEPNGKVTVRGGHMKGVLAFGKGTGFWLVHSVPKYPNLYGTSYGFPSTGYTYGQSFLCITFNSSQANSIGSQFKYSMPNIYDYHLDDWVQSKMNDLWSSVVDSAVVRDSPWYNVTQIYSTTGLQFTYFAKHPKFNEDLYSDLVAPVLKSNLWVETWQHGTNKIPSECADYSVENVKTVAIEPLRYRNGNDHSKWAVSPTGSRTPWFCSGDINRMGTQLKRGGGTVCVSSQRVQKVYDKSTVATELCSSSIRSIFSYLYDILNYLIID